MPLLFFWMNSMRCFISSVYGRSSCIFFDASFSVLFSLKSILYAFLSSLIVESEKPCAFEADGIEAEEFCPSTGSYHVRRDILSYSAETTDHRIGTNPRELMDCYKSADNGVITYRDMTCKGSDICHDDRVPDFAIMCYMDICHEKIIIADSCDTVSANRCPVYCYIFTDRVIIPDPYTCFFTFIFHILWRQPDARERIDRAVLPYLRIALDDDVRNKSRPLFDDAPYRE